MSGLALSHRPLPEALGRGAAVSAAVVRGFRRHPIALLGLLIVTVCPVVWLVVAQAQARSSAAVPADLFMQSVASHDVALGWNQLCASVQAQLPLALAVEQTEAQRGADDEQGVTLAIDHLGDRPRPTGGEIRIYLATAHRADGWTGQKMYVVTTRASGCVESVE
jgi:hypothetical protein